MVCGQCYSVRCASEVVLLWVGLSARVCVVWVRVVLGGCLFVCLVLFRVVCVFGSRARRVFSFSLALLGAPSATSAVAWRPPS